MRRVEQDQLHKQRQQHNRQRPVVAQLIDLSQHPQHRSRQHFQRVVDGVAQVCRLASDRHTVEKLGQLGTSESREVVLARLARVQRVLGELSRYRDRATRIGADAGQLVTNLTAVRQRQRDQEVLLSDTNPANIAAQIVGVGLVVLRIFEAQVEHLLAAAPRRLVLRHAPRTPARLLRRILKSVERQREVIIDSLAGAVLHHDLHVHLIGLGGKQQNLAHLIVGRVKDVGEPSALIGQRLVLRQDKGGGLGHGKAAGKPRGQRRTIASQQVGGSFHLRALDDRRAPPCSPPSDGDRGFDTCCPEARS